MATTIAATSNVVGNCLSLVLPVFIVRDGDDFEKSQVTKLLIITAIISSCMFVIVLLCFEDRPRMPPSHVAEIKRRSQIWQSFKSLFSNSNFLVLTVACCFTGWGYTSILEEVIYDYDYTDASLFTSMIGTTAFVAGFIGSFLISLFAQKTSRLKCLIIISCLTSLIMFACFTFLVGMKIKVLTGVLLSIYRFFNLAAIPLILELGAEMSFPIGESLMAGIIQIPV